MGTGIGEAHHLCFCAGTAASGAGVPASCSIGSLHTCGVAQPLVGVHADLVLQGVMHSSGKLFRSAQQLDQRGGCWLRQPHIIVSC